MPRPSASGSDAVLHTAMPGHDGVIARDTAAPPRSPCVRRPSGPAEGRRDRQGRSTGSRGRLDARGEVMARKRLALPLQGPDQIQNAALGLPGGNTGLAIVRTSPCSRTVPAWSVSNLESTARSRPGVTPEFGCFNRHREKTGIAVWANEPGQLNRHGNSQQHHREILHHVTSVLIIRTAARFRSMTFRTRPARHPWRCRCDSGPTSRCPRPRRTPRRWRGRGSRSPRPPRRRGCCRCPVSQRTGSARSARC